MPVSDLKFPYLLHTFTGGMETAKPCAAMVFHTFHTFHTFIESYTPVHVHVYAHVYVCTGAGAGKNGMEGMEGMEQPCAARLSGFHTSR